MSRIVFAMTGRHLPGGIASVNRAIVSALNDEPTVDLRRISLWPDEPLGQEGGYQTGRPPRHAKVRFALQVNRALYRLKPDVLLFDHIHLSSAVRSPRVRATRVAVYVHGREIAPTPSRRAARLLDRADRILTNSAFNRRLITEATQNANVSLVSPCVDRRREALWAALSDPDRAGERAPVVLLVGRMDASQRRIGQGKGHDELLAIWPDVLERVPDGELWFVGGGDDEPRLRQITRDRGLLPSVRFLGPQDGDDLAKSYRESAVFAMPSHNEGFGIVYAEAMYHGLPCIASRESGASELLEDGSTGFLVDEHDPRDLRSRLLELLLDPDRRTRMGEAAKTVSRERFVFERFSNALLEALDVRPT